MSPTEGIDPTNLAEAGWGFIMASSDDPAVQRRNATHTSALRTLLDHRRSQAGLLYREYAWDFGYRPGETKEQFLARHAVHRGPADPYQMPFYLLIIGDPTEIPYEFQEQLAVQRAVGRICFDTPEQYAGYAQGVVASESTRLGFPRRAAFFAPTSPDDQQSGLIAETLTRPLAASVGQSDWEIAVSTGRGATKARLGALLLEPWSFVFAAGHGMVFDVSDPRQASHQGALLCSDWPGPRQWKQPIPPEHYFGADDIDRVGPHILMLDASYSTGTPAHDSARRQRLALPSGRPGLERAFAAALPQRLLADPEGALAVIGLHERRFGLSAVPSSDRAAAQVEVYASVVRRVLSGMPVGWALQIFSARYAELTSQLIETQEELTFGRTLDAPLLASLWAEANDMRSFSIFGDPAVRLPGTSPQSR